VCGRILVDLEVVFQNLIEDTSTLKLTILSSSINEGLENQHRRSVSRKTIRGLSSATWRNLGSQFLKHNEDDL